MTRVMPPTLFDPSQGATKRDEAIATVDHHHAAWVERALLVVERVARTNRTLTADDVWRALDERPCEPRAMGAVMTRARRLKWIAPTSTFRATEKASQHRQPIRVWNSLLILPNQEDHA